MLGERLVPQLIFDPFRVPLDFFSEDDQRESDCFDGLVELAPVASAHLLHFLDDLDLIEPVALQIPGKSPLGPFVLGGLTVGRVLQVVVLVHSLEGSLGTGKGEIELEQSVSLGRLVLVLRPGLSDPALVYWIEPEKLVGGLLLIGCDQRSVQAIEFDCCIENLVQEVAGFSHEGKSRGLGSTRGPRGLVESCSRPWNPSDRLCPQARFGSSHP